MTFLARLRSVLTMGRGISRGVTELEVADDPIGFFDRWFSEAAESGIMLPEAMTLATATPDGEPGARMVLLKRSGPDGFVFFTNYGSRKARELDANPRAALLFHWSVLQRQVRIEGCVSRISAEESDEYFQSRPRGSRLGAWASKQSEPLTSRDILEQQVRDVEQRFSGSRIPLPAFWGGYRLEPASIEFWQGRVDRLHDRLRYERTADGQWAVTRLYP